MCVTFAFVAQRSIQKPYFGLEHEKLWLKSLCMQKGNRWYFDTINRVTQRKTDQGCVGKEARSTPEH